MPDCSSANEQLPQIRHNFVYATITNGPLASLSVLGTDICDRMTFAAWRIAR